MVLLIEQQCVRSLSAIMALYDFGIKAMYSYADLHAILSTTSSKAGRLTHNLPINQILRLATQRHSRWALSSRDKFHDLGLVYTLKSIRLNLLVYPFNIRIRPDGEQDRNTVTHLVIETANTQASKLVRLCQSCIIL
jgi:hypothetical protein